MLAYLLVGMTIGPFALGWMPNDETTQHLAEFGIVFLMFSIGLEFSLAQLSAMRRTVFGLGGAQVILTIVIVMAIAMAIGIDWRGGLTLGGIIAMSSTAIVAKLLMERVELQSAHGRLVMGVLLFQDIAVVPLLVLLPALAQEPERFLPNFRRRDAQSRFDSKSIALVRPTPDAQLFSSSRQAKIIGNFCSECLARHPRAWLGLPNSPDYPWRSAHSSPAF